LENNWVAFGRTISPETLRLQGNLTKRVPIEVFRAACERACLLTTGGFPPGPGDILEAARLIAPGETVPGQERATPRWWRIAVREIQGRVDERPQLRGPRGGEASFLTIAKEVGE
jgi:hypothetical protein